MNLQQELSQAKDRMFAWFHIVCDRYIPEYAHFTYFNRPTLGITPNLILEPCLYYSCWCQWMYAIYSAESSLEHGKQDFKRDTSFLGFPFNRNYFSLVASRTDRRNTSGKETVSTCSSNPSSSLVQSSLNGHNMNEDHLLSHLADGAVLVCKAKWKPKMFTKNQDQNL